VTYKTEVVCPYCGYKQYFSMLDKEAGSWGRVIHNCNSDNGGCDSSFVVNYKIRMTATVQRIEGEGESVRAKYYARSSGNIFQTCATINLITGEVTGLDEICNLLHDESFKDLIVLRDRKFQVYRDDDRYDMYVKINDGIQVEKEEI